MSRSSTGNPARGLAIAGAVSIVVAIVVSLTTGEDVGWAWGAMILATLIGLVLLVIATAMALRQRYQGRRATAR